MAKFFEAIPDNIAEFIAKQPIFFIATACPTGRINLSPKGMDTLRVLGPNDVAYLDLTGSGNETATHLTLDGRATLMFCSFGSAPLILRLYGTGRVIKRGCEEYDSLMENFPRLAGERQIIRVRVDSVQTSCGYAVPRMEFVEPRTKLVDWAADKSQQEIETYWHTKNMKSIDGFPTPFASDSPSSG